MAECTARLPHAHPASSAATLSCFVLCPCCQVPCRGRGQSPDPAAVNAAVWELRKVCPDTSGQTDPLQCMLQHSMVVSALAAVQGPLSWGMSMSWVSTLR